MIHTIACTDTNKSQTLILHVDAISSSAQNDITGAIKAACCEYVSTFKNKKSNSFNWSDFCAHVPDDICLNHGFRKIGNYIADFSVNHNESLC